MAAIDPLTPEGKRVGMSRYCDALETRLYEANAIMLAVLGYLPDEPGDAATLRESIRRWISNKT